VNFDFNPKKNFYGCQNSKIEIPTKTTISKGHPKTVSEFFKPVESSIDAFKMAKKPEGKRTLSTISKFKRSLLAS